MSELSKVMALLPGIPIEYLVLVVSIAGLVVAFYAIHVVFAVTKGGKKE